MVAPTNKTSLQATSCSVDTTTVGFISRLPGVQDASYKMAPSLSDCVRQSMERKQISVENLSLHLKKVQGSERYNRAFKILWAFMQENKVHPLQATLDEVALFLVRMAKISKHEARNAYSACLFIPELEGLRFNRLLNATKREWNFSPPRYCDFWDASKVLRKLQERPLDFSSIRQVRDRLILVLRLRHLARSIDLERAFRTLSFQDNQLWLLIRRKGAKLPTW